jgi:hypothetical protein
MPTDSITQELKNRILRANDADAPLFPMEARFVITAVVAGLISLSAWIIDVQDPHTNECLAGISNVTRVLCVIAGLCYLSRSAESRTQRMIVRALADAERARRDGYAEGYVAGVRREKPADGSHMQLVN